MICPVVELMTKILDRLSNLDTLEEKRRKDRERKRRVRGHDSCPRTKEDEKGKETFPPAPPIEKRAKGEEKGKKNIARARAEFVPPTPEEVAAFCRERKNAVDPILWWNYYAARGWMIGNMEMVNWKRAVITWERNRKTGTSAVSVDAKAAAFERQRAEAEERRRHAEQLAASILGHRQDSRKGTEGAGLASRALR